MKYVDIDPVTRQVTWDRYFEYLRSVEHELLDPLKSYAMDWAHYSLDDENTLHDGWLVGLNLGANEKEVALEFLGARHDRKHRFQYLGVTSYAIQLDVKYRYGDRNVFVHEFRIEGSSLIHEIMFANRDSIAITSASVLPEIIAIQ